MHVGGLQLYERPEDAGPDFVRELFERATSSDDEVMPLFAKHPYRSVRTAGQLFWKEDEQFDIEHHVRHNALPSPGRVRELLDLCSRLHSTRLDWERPLWEAHLIEGLADGRVAMYTKIHHGLVDGISAMRLMQSTLSTNPDERDMAAPWAKRAIRGRAKPETETPMTDAARTLASVPGDALRTALGVTAEAAGMPGALIKTLSKGMRNETSTMSMHTPRTMFNRNITSARRFAAQDWEIERIRAVGKATGATINDIVLAMCGGAIRAYLLEHDALPDTPLVAMVPVGLKAKESHIPSAEGGNAVGAIMARLGTDHTDPAERLKAVKKSMKDGKDALKSLTPVQILAMSAIGQAPAMLGPALRMQGIIKSPYNLIISNVPGPKTTHYWNGAKLVGNYPLSIPINGMALNITCTSYDGNMGFGITGCRRTVPHLQRLLTFLEDELSALEKAAGI
ncbi:wax ester/triacylglycerol synthase family O-acyltransferase [Nocardioides humilatus]|uniref:Diacylglycerol O-acyltransferase n=2 Tax=Nocardioides humilatus TaxID=2607660 RepID=A0A5B1LG95_9ACTN|nr:wax ester/triacylglycerol synthase family O-acyltransferase [Nocardioides humilatus]